MNTELQTDARLLELEEKFANLSQDYVHLEEELNTVQREKRELELELRRQLPKSTDEVNGGVTTMRHSEVSRPSISEGETSQADVPSEAPRRHQESSSLTDAHSKKSELSSKGSTTNDRSLTQQVPLYTIPFWQLSAIQNQDRS